MNRVGSQNPSGTVTPLSLQYWDAPHPETGSMNKNHNSYWQFDGVMLLVLIKKLNQTWYSKKYHITLNRVCNSKIPFYKIFEILCLEHYSINNKIAVVAYMYDAAALKHPFQWSNSVLKHFPRALIL